MRQMTRFLEESNVHFAKTMYNSQNGQFRDELQSAKNVSENAARVKSCSMPKKARKITECSKITRF